MNLITCQNVSFSYGGKKVLQDINFNVASGDYLCIVGENGAGKSTLAKGMLQLIKPTAGIIQMENGLSANEIGYLPQQTTIQKDFPASVYEIVLSGCLNRLGFKPFYTKEDKRLAEQNMLRMGISHIKNQCYRDLSGGMQQRVLLARALCATKKAVLLDEPTAALDPIMSQELYELIQKINAEGITIIMVSHDIASSLLYAKHILHLYHTQLFFGSVNDYINSAIGQKFIGKGTDVQPLV